MASKFIPDRDADFALMAQNFANALARDPSHFAIQAEDAELLTAAVAKYRAAHFAAVNNQRGAAGAAKRSARKEAEKIIRRLTRLIRANDGISAEDLVVLGLRQWSSKPSIVCCPQEPPRLQFVRALHEGGSSAPKHELSFRAWDRTNRKPVGAVRLELFIDLIGLDEEVPNHPGENHGGRPWYWGSFPRSPMVITPPMPSVPTLVLYWARWAGRGACDVGPFCQTVVSTIVGGMKRFVGPQVGKKNQLMMLEDPNENRDVTIRIAVLETQRKRMLPTSEPEDPKRLAGPEAA